MGDALVGRVRAGNRITVAKGQRGAGKTTLLDFVAARLAADGCAAIRFSAAGQSAMDLHAGIAAAAGAGGGTMPHALIRVLGERHAAGRVVLLIDDADRLSGPAAAYLDLLLQLTQFASQPLAVVLFGGLGPWPGLAHPGLNLLTPAAIAPQIIQPLDPAEAADALRRWTRSPGGQGLPRAMAADLLDEANGVPGDLRALVARAMARRQHGPALLRSRRAAVPALVAMVAAVVVLLLPAGVLRREPSAISSGPQPSTIAAILPPASPPSPAEAPQDTAQATPPASAPASPAPAQTAGPAIMTARRTPGLVILAMSGDTMPRLYSRVYRGMTPPPYAEVVASNPAQFRPGALVVFPEPPGGWLRH